MKYPIVISLLSASVLSGQVAIVDEDFSSPSKISNSGGNGSLGTGGDGFSYDGNFGTWLFSNGNGGINEAAAGRGDGINPDAPNNAISSIGLNRPQDGAGTNGRINTVVIAGSNFVVGSEYTVSFDVIGGQNGDGNAGSATAGRMWLASLSGYDNSGSNYIQIDGTWNGLVAVTLQWPNHSLLTVLHLLHGCTRMKIRLMVKTLRVSSLMAKPLLTA